MLLQAIVDNATPIGIVGMMCYMVMKQNGEANKRMLDLHAEASKAITELSKSAEKDKLDGERFDRVLSLFESTITKVTATQEKIAVTLDSVLKRQESFDEQFQELRIELLRNNYKGEGRHEKR